MKRRPFSINLANCRSILVVSSRLKQAGTGPSRRHIQGSKIAKGLPSVNLQYSKIENPRKWTEWRAKRDYKIL